MSRHIAVLLSLSHGHQGHHSPDNHEGQDCHHGQDGHHGQDDHPGRDGHQGRQGHHGHQDHYSYNGPHMVDISAFINRGALLTLTKKPQGCKMKQEIQEGFRCKMTKGRGEDDEQGSCQW